MAVTNQIKSGLSMIGRLQTASKSSVGWKTIVGEEVKKLGTRKEFSTSGVMNVKSKKQKKEISRQKAKAYEAKRQTEESVKVRMKPDPILGYSTQIAKDYLRWERCELNRLILKNEDVWTGKIHSSSENHLLNFGLNDNHHQRSILFDGLPNINQVLSFKNLPSFDTTPTTNTNTTTGTGTTTTTSTIDKQEEEIEKKNKLLRIFHLRNSNSKGIDKFNKDRILKAFSPKNQNHEFNQDQLDPGCSEVQAAIMTYRIHTVLNHAWKNGRDKSSKRHLSDLVMKRMKILKYLKRTNLDRYLLLLPRIGLEPKYLNDELIVRSKLPLRPGESLD